MQLTIRRLHDIRACAEARDWFAARYPDGLDLSLVTEADMIDAIRDGMHPGWVEWAVAHLPAQADRLCTLLRTDAVRAAAIRNGHGYWYARCIDGAPRDDTRAAAIREGHGYEYALHIDCRPRDDTRAAAIAEGHGYEYAWHVDGARDGQKVTA